jgi:hypothetical protein
MNDHEFEQCLERIDASIERTRQRLNRNLGPDGTIALAEKSVAEACAAVDAIEPRRKRPE